MSVWRLLPVLFLIGCGSDLADADAESWATDRGLAHNYGADCLPYIYSNAELDGLAIRDLVIEARKAMVGKVDGIQTDEQWCTIFSGIFIEVLPHTGWNTDQFGHRTLGCSTYQDPTCKTGAYNLFDGIVLSRSMRSLAHELLHHWDAVHLQVGTSQHYNWENNGYDEISRNFVLNSQHIQLFE